MSEAGSSRNPCPTAGQRIHLLIWGNSATSAEAGRRSVPPVISPSRPALCRPSIGPDTSSYSAAAEGGGAMEDRLRVASRWIREILLVLALLATTSRARANRSSEEPQENAARTEADTRAEGSVKEELPADRTGRSGALVSVPRLQGEIRLDGVSDEPAWQLVEPVPLITETPEFGGPPAEPTEIRIAYDDEYLYVSGRMYAAPEHVFAASFKRDLFTPGTDYLGVSLDTFNDNESAVLFWTSPTGTRTDATLSNDGEGDTFLDNSWNVFWDVAAVRSQEGWFAEMRIPFHSLRFQSTEGRVVMGVSVYRWIAKKNE